jgi:tetratricopeptide (TPR) repeat protein
MTYRTAVRNTRLPVVALGLAAVALSLALVPRGRELALLRMEAGDTQRAAALLEARFVGGDRSPATVAALARARVSIGDVAGAMQLLETLIAQRPRDAGALNKLEQLQRDSGRTEGLIRTLEMLQNVAPRTDRLRDLAGLYAKSNRRPEQLAALRNLVQQVGSEPDDFVTLARLEASMGRPLAGVAVLRDMETRHLEAVDASVVALELGMLLVAKEAEQALARGRLWLVGRSDLAQAAPILAGEISVGGRPDLAVALLKHHAGADADPRLIAALAQAESDAGDPAAGLNRLEQLDPVKDARGGVPVALLRLRLGLAVGNADRAMAAAERVGWPDVPDDLLQQLSATALAAGRKDALQRLAAAGEDYLNSAPVLAARIRLALGDADGARRWSDRATPTVLGQPGVAVQLAEVEVHLKRSDRVAALLLDAVQDPDLPPTALPAVAGLFIRAGRADKGAIALDRVRRSQASLAADSAWALTAIAAGRAKEVTAWLFAQGQEELPADLLQNLVHVAVDAGARGLALQAAERLTSIRGSADDGLLLARLLFDNGQPRRALECLRALPAGTSVPDDFRAAVLLGAWRQGAPVADKLRAIWLRRLEAATNPVDQAASISLLFELRAHTELLPVLHTLARQAPERWLWAFSEAATAARRQADLTALWMELVGRPGLPAELRRQLAFKLLEAGDKRAAERAFRVLAATSPSDSPDVRQLLFLWGPRPTAEQLDWIEDRARMAGGAEQGAWMRILADRGAPARSAAVYRAAMTQGGAPEAALGAYLAALQAQDDRTTMVAAVREELPRATTAAHLRQLAGLAARAGDTELERQTLERLVATGGWDRDAQRRLGMLAYLRRDMDVAERLLSATVAQTGGDYDTQMILGDIASRRRGAAEARSHYAEALRLLESSGDRSFRGRVVRANLLHRLGRDAEATRLYEALLTERPSDRNLRADYAAMLIEQGALRHASDLLAGR